MIDVYVEKLIGEPLKQGLIEIVKTSRSGRTVLFRDAKTREAFLLRPGRQKEKSHFQRNDIIVVEPLIT